ncbi:GNAT superfamily N-acetyltransferase [Microbacterium phyllosphaerae]|uniref:GNAT superfamily N-acetyltransferase n=1 Tax=Microbacterium phyllosphaerae TaxID=124798 RepID=A0ABS4WND9_9MICO|nr:GNAT family N-acetyltransferase [Microbacterium phyllosphaerae]MBP2377721.1 GNAT superfamily N-acetyltransferase [Microbacterium phyllosphaerae]
MPLLLTPLPADRFDDWLATTRVRLIALRRESGMLVGEDAAARVDEFVGELLAEGHETPTSLILEIEDDGVALGTAWLAANNGVLFLVDLAFGVSPSEAQRGRLLAELRTLARTQQVTRISMGVYASDSESRAFVESGGFEVASIQMLLEPLPSREGRSRVVVSPMTAERFTSFAVASEAAFAADLAASGRYSEEDAAVESHRQMQLELPDGVASEGQELFVAEVDGDEVGVLWIGVRARAGRPHAFILDIEIAEGHRRRGYGRDVMHAAEREARRLGADSIGLHVFGFNTGAIRLYESLGYRRVEERFLLTV